MYWRKQIMKRESLKSIPSDDLLTLTSCIDQAKVKLLLDMGLGPLEEALPSRAPPSSSSGSGSGSSSSSSSSSSSKPPAASSSTKRSAKQASLLALRSPKKLKTSVVVNLPKEVAEVNPVSEVVDLTVPILDRTQTWEAKFQEMCDYKLKYGHCLVPQQYPSLGQWVKAQRTRYSSIQDGTPWTRKKFVTAERIAKLIDIGFVFLTRKRRHKKEVSVSERAQKQIPT
jgi:hypothetical protein